MRAEVDAVVVGGRIAGSLTALRLAERGVSVRVLESRHFPSDTLSTHFFRGDGLVRSLADSGVAVVVVSSEVEEVLGLADRVLVVREGRVVHEGPASEIDESQVLDHTGFVALCEVSHASGYDRHAVTNWIGRPR